MLPLSRFVAPMEEFTGYVKIEEVDAILEDKKIFVKGAKIGRTFWR